MKTTKRLRNNCITLLIMFLMILACGKLSAQTGPAASGSFINIDFNSLTGKQVVPELFGGSTIAMVDGPRTSCCGATFDGMLFTNSAFQSASKALGLPLMRFNSGSYFWEDAFANLSSPNWGSNTGGGPNTMIWNMNKCFDLTKCKLVIGIGGGNNAGPWSVSQFASICSQIVTHFKNTPGSDGKIVQVYAWEILNESTLSSSTYDSYFNAAADAIHAVDPTVRVAGPTSPNNQGAVGNLIANAGPSRLGMSDDHVYLYCPGGSDPVPTDNQVSQAICTQGTPADSYANGINSIISGNFGSNIPWLIGEYGVGCGPSDPNGRDNNLIGALFAASYCMKNATIANTTIYAGLWEYGPSGGWGQLQSNSSNWFTGTAYTPMPPVIFLSKATTTLPGNLVSAQHPGNGGLEVWATVNGNNLGVLVTNPAGNGAQSGQVALSHWPVSSTGNGTVFVWQQSPTNTNGTITSVTVTNGVTASINFPAASNTIIYSSAPTNLSTGVTASISSICSGNSTTLTASGAVTYSWSPSAGLSSTTGAIVIATPTISTTYIVTGTDASNNKTTASIGITVSVAPSKPTIAKDNCNELVSSASGTSQWYLNGTVISGVTGQTYQPTQNGIYTVQTNNGGCMSASSQTYNYTVLPFSDTASCVNAIVIDGILNETAWNGTSKNICKVATGTSGGISSNFKIHWNNQYLYVGVDVTDPTLSNSSATIYQNSAVEVFLDMNNGKSATYTAYDFHYIFGWNNPTMWEVNNRTTGVIFKTANKTGGFQLEVAIPWTTLLVTPASGTIYGADAAIDISHTAGTRTGQLVWSGDQNNWQSASNFGIVPLNGNCVTTSIGQNLSLQNSFSVYPNPFTGNATLTVNAVVSGNYNINVMDITGRFVYHSTIYLTAANEQNILLPLENVSRGMYMLSIENNNTIKRMKMIKE